MATVATKPMTAAEFYEWTHRPENQDKLFELERGEVIELANSGKRHGAPTWLVLSEISRLDDERVMFVPMASELL